MRIKKYIPAFIRSTDVPSINRVDTKSALLGFLTGMVLILLLTPFRLMGFFVAVLLVVGIVLGIKYILYTMVRDNKIYRMGSGASFPGFDKDEYSMPIKKDGTIVCLDSEECSAGKRETPPS